MRNPLSKQNVSEETYKGRKLFIRESLLNRLMGDEDLVKQVLAACLLDLSSKLERFRQQLAEDSLVEARRTIHSIKGSAQNSDLAALLEISKEIEDLLSDGQSEKALSLQGELSQVVGESIRVVEQYLADRA